MIPQAFVLGAGLGTRLRPLTDELPKPLVPIFQKPLLTFALDHLAAAGVTSFAVNTHHLPAAFEKLFVGDHYRDYPVKLLREPVLLETGGGIKNAEASLGTSPFFIYSGDILTDLPLAPLIEEHLRSGNDVTLALRQTGLAKHVAFRDGRVVGIGERSRIPGDFDFANISIWNPSAFARFSLGKKISFIPILARYQRARLAAGLS
jgi:mannose-1-phosphate guanylyltransferase